ncbi:MAG: ThuA domain-containing protein, partial [Blastopirellula sp. JB062]
RLKVDVSQNIEDLATLQPGDYDLLVLNYCNWKLPGLSDAAKKGLVEYLQAGGGLLIVHFANGAFHHSLPNQENSDWPEYRKICRRVWDHSAKSGHDRFGEFAVKIEKKEHPITQGIADFRTTDELYFRQEGDLPIEVLATAKSNVTGQDEPMAFVYEYGQARVFQTVLGHAAESLRTPNVAAMLRKAAAWVARRPQAEIAVEPPVENTPPRQPARFGKAFSGPGGVYVAANKKYREAPLTVECWARLDRQDQFNILLANELKESATHWELFTRAGDGRLAAYMPGMRPDHVISDVNLCDGQWHYVAMQYEPQRVRLYVDAKLVADQAIAFQKGKSKPGPLGIGALVSKRIERQGAIDEVRISRGVRKISTLPTAPFSADETTIGLWHLDEAADAKSFRDESSGQNEAAVSMKAKPPQNKENPDHFGKEVVGFDWTEKDSVDSRWNEMDVGRFLASTIPLPKLAPVQKGLSIRLGKNQEANVCYDTQRLALRAAWTGPFLKFNPARFGLIASPSIAGDLAFVSDETEGWRQPVRWQGLYQHRDQVALSYQVDGRDVLEAPTLIGNSTFARTFQVSPSSKSITLHVGRFGEKVQLKSLDGLPTAVTRVGDRIVAVAAVGIKPAQLTASDSGTIKLHLPGNDTAQIIRLLTWSGTAADLDQWRRDVALDPSLPDLTALTRPGPPRWNEPIVTEGKLGTDEAPYALDTLTIPFDNPYKALMFVGGHDFFSNGDLAVCTVHGDLWRVSGVDASLKSLRWRRMATGLFQPLGVRVVDDVAYVLGRDQITRLHDTNQDGEADYYENFCNLYQTSPGGHDYVACLETDSAGNFYLIHANQGIVKISSDGEKLEIIATGMRNPNGLAVSASGVITAAPQEGTWTPASCVIRAQPGGYYGYGGPRVTDRRPLGYDPPLCWIPRLRDNSSGGQVWVKGDRWGPLSGKLIHFSYGKCTMMLVPQEKVRDVWQGGTVEFPLTFDSGVMRGRFSPHDGQLYASGLNGWVTAAAHDGCLQRVRYTGRPVTMPVD